VGLWVWVSGFWSLSGLGLWVWVSGFGSLHVWASGFGSQVPEGNSGICIKGDGGEEISPATNHGCDIQDAILAAIRSSR
jgi:hypothetical protein